MVIQCGACGKDIEVSGELMDGQHVLCPWCGEKTKYAKPSRIELPTGVRKRPILEAKPALRVIREPKPTAQPVVDPNAKKTIYMAEEHARFYEEMKVKESRRKALEKISGLLGLAIVIGGAWAGYELWTRHKERKEQVRLAQEAENLRLQKERNEELARQEAERRAQEEKARARRAVEEAARAKREKERREQEAAQVRQVKELYWQAATTFADADLQFISALGTNALPGSVDGRFFYLIPSIEEDRERIVVCDSSARGVTNLYWLGKGAEKEQIGDITGFLARADKTDYLLAHEGKMYLHSKRPKIHVGEIDKENPSDLVEAFLGAVAGKAKQFDCECGNVSFEIVFVSEKPRKVIPVDVVEYGCQYSLEKVRDAVEDAFPFRSRGRKASASKGRFKRTVVFWDGALIKRGIDGVTYVPRTPPPAAYHDYNDCSSSNLGGEWRVTRPFGTKRWRRAEQTRDHWQSLFDEAKRQDAEEQAFYQKRRDESLAKESSAAASEMAAYSEKIDNIIKRGMLYFRARLSGDKTPERKSTTKATAN